MKPIYLIIGLPGSGKNTQASLLAKELGLPNLDAGDSIKEYINYVKENDPAKAEIMLKGYQGGPTNPTEVLLASITRKIEFGYDQGFVFSQNAISAEEIEEEIELFKKFGFEIKKAFCLNVSRETALNRLIKRLNNKFTEKEPDLKSLEQRVDNYIKVFDSIKACLKQKELLVEIDGELSIDYVFKKIMQEVKIP